MAHGILLNNDAGAILIDGEHSNYALIAEGRNIAVGGVGYTVGWSPIDSVPLVFARLESSSKYVRIRNLSTTGVTFQVFGTPASGSDFSVLSSGVIDYMVFARAHNVAPSSGWGIHVYDAEPKLVFDSNRLAPRVDQIAVIPAVATPHAGNKSPTSVVAHTAGSNPWMMMNISTHPYGFVNYAGGTSELLYPAFRSIPGGTQIQCRMVDVSTIGTTGTQWANVSMTLALMTSSLPRGIP